MSNIYLKSSSNHVDSLIDFVNEVKPYRTKLLSISEEYSFLDSIPVTLIDKHDLSILLGGDIARYSAENSVARRSSSWVREIYSDGIERSFSIPPVAKFKPSNNNTTFILGESYQPICPSGARGVLKTKDMPGGKPISVKKNGVEQVFNSDYFVCDGAFSFYIFPNEPGILERRWKEHSVKNSSAHPYQSGKLQYDDFIRKSYGTIKNISNGNNREWVLTCTSTSPATLQVADSNGINYGSVIKDVLFSLAGEIEFLFTQDEYTSAEIAIGDEFRLTPKNKLLISDSAIGGETWTLFKVRNSSKILVHGSQTGWSTDAEIGKWYFNGSIGFKHQMPTSAMVNHADLSAEWSVDYIPQLSYLNILNPASLDLTEEYIISFGTPSRASVFSNKNGFLSSLDVGTEWSDGQIQLKFGSNPMAGSVFRILVSFSKNEYYGYDESEYDVTEYDTSSAKQWIYSRDFTDIINGIIIKNVASSDTIVVKVAAQDEIQLFIQQSNLYQKVNLNFEYRLDDSYLVFPEIAGKIQAFLAEDTAKPVFTITQTVNQLSGKVSGSVLEFDSNFFNENLEFTSKFKIVILQDQLYLEKINVGILENLYIDDTDFTIVQSQMSSRNINKDDKALENIGASFNEKITFTFR